MSIILQHCGVIMVSLAIGAIFGARLTSREYRDRSFQPNFDEFDLFCDDKIDSEVIESYCYSHPYTVNGSQLEYLEKDVLTFLVIGDWGRNGHCCQNDVAIEMSRVRNLSFVVNTGDSFYESGITSPRDSKIETSWLQVYNQEKLLEVPWYSILGNHDYRSKPEYEMSMSALHESWVLPSRNYFKVIEETLLLVFIDTTPLVSFYRTDVDDIVREFLPKETIENERKKTLKFLDESFAKFENEGLVWRVVVGHHPVYTIGEHYRKEDIDGFLEEELSRNLLKNKVDAYFSGHDHNLQHLSHGGTQFFVSGAGSKIRGFPVNKPGISSYKQNGNEKVNVKFHIGQQGYIGVSLSKREMLVQFFNLRGAWMYSHLLTKTLA